MLPRPVCPRTSAGTSGPKDGVQVDVDGGEPFVVAFEDQQVVEQAPPTTAKRPERFQLAEKWRRWRGVFGDR